jgi:iron complex outermembrane receptor protein
VRATPDGTAARLVNVRGATRTRGTELLLRYRREPWAITASHTYVHATEPAPAGAGRREVPLTPRHIAGLVAVYERHGAGRAGIEIYYTGRQRVDDNPYRTSPRAYAIVGVLVEKRFGRARAFLNLENLTDTRQTRYDPIVLPAPGPWGRRTTDSWAPLEGRVFNGGLRLAF